MTVSVNLLDHVTNDQGSGLIGSDFYNNEFKLDQVVNEWNEKERIIFNGVSLTPIHSNHIATVVKWLQVSDIDKTFIGFFPKDEQRLHDYLIEKPDHKYFAIIYDDQHFVGIIGAENIDHNFKKLEIKMLPISQLPYLKILNYQFMLKNNACTAMNQHVLLFVS